MPPSIITTLVLLSILGLFKILERNQRAKSDKILKRVMDVQSSSYSLMAILAEPKKEIKARLENFVENSGYQIVGSRNIRKSFTQWNNNIYFDSKSIRKGIIDLKSAVVFNDPESVIITDREKIKQLSLDLDCRILVFIWEKVSWTVIFEVYNCGDLISTTSVTEDKPDKDNLNPDVTLSGKADGDTLKIVSMNNGVPIRELFDSNELGIIEYRLRSTV